MKRVLGLLMLLFLCSGLVAMAEVENIDLLSLTGNELLTLSGQVDNAIELYHKPNSESKETALSITKDAVESHFDSQGIDISWAWIDYSYTKDWDFYTITTHVDYKDANKKTHELNVYAELFPEEGRHALYYLLIGTEVIINRRDELPEIRWKNTPKSIINSATEINLAPMTIEDLERLKDRINDEYNENHKPKSSINSLVLSLTEVAIEDYYDKQGFSVEWAWFDYDYVREWDYYSLRTPITYKNDNESHNATVYAEAYPFSGQYSLCYLAIDDTSLLDKRSELPANLHEYANHEAVLVVTTPVATLVPKEAPEATEKPTEKPTAKPTSSPAPAILTKENCPEFNEVLQVKDEFAPIIKNFAAKYSGYTVEFDGYVAYKGDSGFSKYDILVYAGDYSETSVSGPNFQFVNVSDSGFEIGDNVRITAKVSEYNEFSGLFKLNLVSMTERTKGTITSASVQYETLKPGSKGQAVLNARMKLYDLGYFKKKPTQTEYTNNMKDYVKEFEKDYGLEQDGILSPEDQMVLFAQSGPTPKPTTSPKPTATPSIADSEAWKNWVNSQFSPWDGAHRELEKLIVKNLNDEKSYDHIKTTYIEICDEGRMDIINKALKDDGYSRRVKIGDLFITTEFSAKNRFNATVKNTAYGIASYEDNTIILVDIVY